MSWPVGSIYLQKEIARTIANFTEVYSLISTMTWKLTLNIIQGFLKTLKI